MTHCLKNIYNKDDQIIIKLLLAGRTFVINSENWCKDHSVFIVVLSLDTAAVVQYDAGTFARYCALTVQKYILIYNW
jgi:hypothetical protein